MAAFAFLVVSQIDISFLLTEKPAALFAGQPAAEALSKDRLALGMIFDDQHVAGSALHIHLLAAAMPADERYEFLENWVLPGPDHATYRLALDFTPTHPAPIFAKEVTKASGSPTTQSARVQIGGDLVSPALDLIETAAALGQLSALRTRIEHAEARGEVQERSRLALLVLTELAAKDFERALAHFDELFGRVADKTYDEFAGRWPETLAIHGCVRHAETREAATDLLYRLVQSQVREGVSHGPPAWNRWVTATMGRAVAARRSTESQEVDARAPVDRADRDILANWSPVSRTTAWSRGQGMPCAVWRLSPGWAENLVSHDDDYLFYHIPLRGNFEVECDVTSFSWRDTHLMVAGNYVAPVYDHLSYGIGAFGNARPAGTIDPPLSECGEWIRYRAVVRDGTCSTYFNGRLIHTEKLTEEHDPWVAIRSPAYTDGAVRDLRITGHPEIPDQLCLSRSSDLTGWSAYHGEPISGEQAYWRQRGTPEDGEEIFGRREPWLARQGVERLLQYSRPMLEDGTIEYEFYYHEGNSHVHPALDRRVFVLDSDGVRIHWMTDGLFNRTELSPLNVVEEPENRRGPSRLPLHENEWNRMRLQLTGNRVDLFLNDHLIYEVEIEPTNLRTFGLFHWADQTEARVRNVVWTGNWPKELPPVEQQELAGEGTRDLDQRIPELPARFDHDFTRNGLPPEWFVVQGSVAEWAVVPGQGVRLVARAANQYLACWIAPKLRLHGDFDVTAEFDGLVPSGVENASCGISLMAITDDPWTTHSMVYRGTLWRPGTRDRRIIQAEFTRVKPGGKKQIWPGTTAEEATSGTLRLARRGDKVYCLFAEADSPNFRLIHTETIATDATLREGLRLNASVFSGVDDPSESAVTWKRVAVYAERISDLPAGNSERVMVE